MIDLLIYLTITWSHLIGVIASMGHFDPRPFQFSASGEDLGCGTCKADGPNSCLCDP